MSSDESSQMLDLVGKLIKERDTAIEEMNLARALHEIANQQRMQAQCELDNSKITELHSCSQFCERPACVLRRERDEAMGRLVTHRVRDVRVKQLLEKIAKAGDAPHLGGFMTTKLAHDAISLFSRED